MMPPRGKELLAFGANIALLVALIWLNAAHRTPYGIAFIIIGIIILGIWGADVVQRLFK